MSSRSVLVAAMVAAAVAVEAAPGTGQRPIRAPVEVRIGGRPSPDAGAGAPRLFESATLDRYLRKASDFLGRADYASAIKVLQDVLEGNIHAGQDADGKGGADAAVESEDDPSHAVFTSDGRLYRPVRRLCRDMLVSMPAAGGELYRQKYEVEAERHLQSALQQRDLHGLEATYRRYVATKAALRAMVAAADLLMQQGRLRSAIQAFRGALEIYPAEFRATVAGLSEPYVLAKLAYCYLLAGERARADDVLKELEKDHGQESLRLMGELVPIAALRQHAMFQAHAATQTGFASAARGGAIASATQLVPLWVHRFGDPEPYSKQGAARQPQGMVLQLEGGASVAVPRRAQFLPGPAATVEGGDVAFFDYTRLCHRDALSGRLLDETQGAVVSAARTGDLSGRIAVYDWSTMRVVPTADAWLGVIPRGRRPTGPLDNELVAHRRAGLVQEWSTRAWAHAANQDLGFLAAPTQSGKRLLVPVMVGGAYALQAIDAATGESLYRVPLHSGGSELLRAPTPPILVHQGIAYMLTNAGVIAAVDEYSGELLWLRRYEHAHPRDGDRAAVRAPVNRLSVAREVTLDGFVPSDLFGVDGRVVVAPSDGHALLCLDGANGELLWLVEAPQDRDVYLVGHNTRNLYLCGDDSLMCIDLRTGVRRFSVETPTRRWVGRGFVDDECVALPDDRALDVMPAEGGQWRRLDLSQAQIGQEPLHGPANLVADGIYLLVCYEGGIEAFAALEGLREAAANAPNPEQRAVLLAQAGDYAEAAAAYGQVATDGSRDDTTRSRMAARALALARDQALALAARDDRERAFAVVDACRPWLLGRPLQLRWQLLRIELCGALHDPAGELAERDELYRMLEGRR